MKQLLGQFVRFSIIGGINFILDFVIYLSLTRFFDFWSEKLVLATAVAFVVANCNSYILNKYWTFKAHAEQHRVQYPKFVMVSLIGLLINTSTFYMLVTWVQLSDIMSKIIVAGIVLFWNFTVNRFWTFRKSFASVGENNAS